MKNITIFIVVLYFILRTYGVVQLTSGLWALPLIVLSAQSLHLVLSQNFKITKYLLVESKWIIFSIFILLIYILYDYGNFKLDTTFSYLLTSIPFYIIGFYNGIKVDETFIKKITIFYLIFLGIYLLPKTITVLTSGSFNSSFFTSLFVSKEDTDFIFFLPFVAFITIFGYKLMRNSKLRLLKISATIILFFNILALFLSSKAAPIVMLLFSIIIYFFKGSKKIQKKYNYLFLSVLLIFLFILGVSTGLFGELGSLKSKSTAFIDLIINGFIISDEALNNISSDRWFTSLYSIEQFFKKPFFGNGAYLESVGGMLGNVEDFTTAAGGHSFVLDTMAYYGVFGLPIILILFKFSKDGFRYYKSVKNIKIENNQVLLFSSLMTSVFILNILNTGFLFSYFDNFLFLLSGFYLGKLYRTTRIKKSLI